MWRHIAQSVQGSSHVREQTPCQDCCQTLIHAHRNQQTLIVCVADGAGSASQGAEGAAMACDIIIDKIRGHCDATASLVDFKREDAVAWCEHARARLLESATTQDVPIREFATTLCCAIVSSNASCFFQVGDGAIVLRQHGALGAVFWPQSGEYANMTSFLTSPDFVDRLDFINVESTIDQLAMFTDGIERLALQFDNRVPHAPFFEPLFAALAGTTPLDELNAGLRQFLASESMQARSDDDKTLVLAIRNGESTTATD